MDQTTGVAMRSLFSRTLFIPAAMMASIAWGQQNTTLQLPTFNFTTVSTTVSVPDGGTGLLGGIGRLSEGSVTRGVPMLSKIPGLNRFFKNRGIGRDTGMMNMTVQPRIIILEEEELRQTGFSLDSLSEWDGQGASGVSAGFGGAVAQATDPETASKAAFLTHNVGRPETQSDVPARADEPLPSLAEIRRQNEQADARQAAEAEEYYAQGRRAESEGKAGVAKIYYQMALRRADAALQQEILTRLSTLDGEQKPARLADR